jgi:6-pyruvoyltetrahydropterin/6-carboxytetrahydropterin synthase
MTDLEYLENKLATAKTPEDIARYTKQIELMKDAAVIYKLVRPPEYPPISYKYTSTKEYIDAFPCAYRQWRADSHCNKIHGYAFSMKFYFGTNDLDVRNWAADYGGLKDLKKILEDQFDHTLLGSADDPELEIYKLLQEKKMAKITILPRLGCESLADMLYKYVNGVYIPDMWGPGEAARLWCYKVEVRETQANMAFREGHREWNEDLFAE